MKTITVTCLFSALLLLSVPGGHLQRQIGVRCGFGLPRSPSMSSPLPWGGLHLGAWLLGWDGDDYYWSQAPGSWSPGSRFLLTPGYWGLGRKTLFSFMKVTGARKLASMEASTTVRVLRPRL